VFVIDLAFSKLFATDELVGTGFILTAREITFFNIFAERMGLINLYMGRNKSKHIPS
jgi:hypothetical protein